MKKISINISGHQTSVSLEAEFINALKQIARAQKKSVADIIREIDTTRPRHINLSSAIRVWTLETVFSAQDAN